MTSSLATCQASLLVSLLAFCLGITEVAANQSYSVAGGIFGIVFWTMVGCFCACKYCRNKRYRNPHQYAVFVADEERVSPAPPSNVLVARPVEGNVDTTNAVLALPVSRPSATGDASKPVQDETSPAAPNSQTEVEGVYSTITLHAASHDLVASQHDIPQAPSDAAITEEANPSLDEAAIKEEGDPLHDDPPSYIETQELCPAT